MRVGDFLDLRWEGGEAPLIEPPAFSPVIADPSFLFPEETPFGDWILYAHSAWGLHEYRSADGLSWRGRGLKAANAMRPFLRRLGCGEYVLLYEKYLPLAMPLQILPVRRRWKSRIEMRRSGDVARWGRPVTVIRPERPWTQDGALGDSVSNPCLAEEGGRQRLYFSGGLSWIPDCGFCEPRYIGMAVAAYLGAFFEQRPEPIIDPASDGLPGVLGAGSLKAIRLEDGWIGLQNKIYRDSGGRSRSAIFLLRSGDGISWENASDEPIIAPDAGWKASHVYACDCRYREADGRWYLYFNARDGWKISEGKERIGRMVGS